MVLQYSAILACWRGLVAVSKSKGRGQLLSANSFAHRLCPDSSDQGPGKQGREEHRKEKLKS